MSSSARRGPQPGSVCPRPARGQLSRTILSGRASCWRSKDNRNPAYPGAPTPSDHRLHRPLENRRLHPIPPWSRMLHVPYLTTLPGIRVKCTCNQPPQQRSVYSSVKAQPNLPGHAPPVGHTRSSGIHRARTPAHGLRCLQCVLQGFNGRVVMPSLALATQHQRCFFLLVVSLRQRRGRECRRPWNTRYLNAATSATAAAAAACKANVGACAGAGAGADAGAAVGDVAETRAFVIQIK